MKENVPAPSTESLVLYLASAKEALAYPSEGFAGFDVNVLGVLVGTVTAKGSFAYFLMLDTGCNVESSADSVCMQPYQARGERYHT